MLVKVMEFTPPKTSGGHDNSRPPNRLIDCEFDGKGWSEAHYTAVGLFSALLPEAYAPGFMLSLLRRLAMQAPASPVLLRESSLRQTIPESAQSKDRPPASSTESEPATR